MSAFGKQLINDIQHARAVLRGEAEGEFVVHVPEQVDVKALRAKLGLSQHAFAVRFGFTAATVKNWEQGIRQPNGSDRAYLKVIEREPEAVARALQAA